MPPWDRFAPERQLHHLDVADSAAFVEFVCLRTQNRTDPLRADLHDSIVFVRRLDHCETVGHIVRHRFLAINVLAGIAGVHHNPPVPVVRNRGHNAVDVLAVEQFLVMPRGRKAGVARQFFGQRMPPVHIDLRLRHTPRPES